MTTKWDELTAAEREEYVNQDRLPRGWLENLECEMGKARFKDAVENNSLLDIFTSGDDIEALLTEILTPLQYACFYEHYTNGRTAAEIADILEVQYVIDGRVVSKKGVTLYSVKNEIPRARKAILRRVEEKLGLVVN